MIPLTQYSALTGWVQSVPHKDLNKLLHEVKDSHYGDDTKYT